MVGRRVLPLTAMESPMLQYLIFLASELQHRLLRPSAKYGLVVPYLNLAVATKYHDNHRRNGTVVHHVCVLKNARTGISAE